jgi:hypothetical protein
MNKVNFIIISEEANTGENNNLSFINTFNTAKFSRLPAAYPTFFITVNIGLERLNQTYNCKIIIKKKNTDGEDIVISESPFINVETEDSVAKEVNLVSNFSGVSFTEAGKHEISVLLDGVEIANRNFYIISE